MFNFRTGGAKYCPFNFTNGVMSITQTAGTNCQLSSNNVNNLTSQFQTQLTNETQQFIQQNASNSQGWFATAFSLQIQGATTVDDVMNQIKNSTKGNFNNTCTSVSSALNEATVRLCGYYDSTTFDFNQNALITAITSCINQNVIDTWTSNTVLNQLWQQTDQQLASTQSGLSMGLIILIIVIIVIVIILAGVGFFILK